MKKTVPVSAVVAIIVLAVVIAGVFGYRTLFPTREENADRTQMKQHMMAAMPGAPSAAAQRQMNGSAQMQSRSYSQMMMAPRSQFPPAAAPGQAAPNQTGTR